MYYFKKINKTKMYQLVKEFAGIRDLPPSKHCQFGYYSRTNSCYLVFTGRPDRFKVEYDHLGNDVYLLVSQKPDLNLTYPERKDEVVHLNLCWLHNHGYLDEGLPAEEAV